MRSVRYSCRGWVFFGPYRRGQGLTPRQDHASVRDRQGEERGRHRRRRAAVMVRLLESGSSQRQLAALAWLKKASIHRPKSDRCSGDSFSGIETLLGAERVRYCAAVDSAGGAESWALAPQLQSIMVRPVSNSKAPVFFFQAQNDFDLTPTTALASAMQHAGKTSEMKVYPAFGRSPQEGHTFGYFGSSVWSEDVFRFLNRYCST